jgi:hypothetical protein
MFSSNGREIKMYDDMFDDMKSCPSYDDIFWRDIAKEKRKNIKKKIIEKTKMCGEMFGLTTEVQNKFIEECHSVLNNVDLSQTSRTHVQNEMYAAKDKINSMISAFLLEHCRED